MPDSQLDFAALVPVNHLWPSFVDRLGTDRAQRGVRQALGQGGGTSAGLNKRISCKELIDK